MHSSVQHAFVVQVLTPHFLLPSTVSYLTDKETGNIEDKEKVLTAMSEGCVRVVQDLLRGAGGL